MQTYGNFFNPPKSEKQIVDKWSTEKEWEKCYFNRFTSMYSTPDLLSAPVFCTGMFLLKVRIQGDFSLLLFSLSDFYSME